MEMKEFTQKVRYAIEKELGEGYRVELKEITKNNGFLLQGLLIVSKEENLIPTIYLDPFFTDYEEGMPLSDIVKQILAIYREETPRGNFDMEFFRNYDAVKDRICYRLISREANKELLKDIPHIEFLDLAICFFYVYNNEAIGEGTILIHHSHKDLWGVTVEELQEAAKANTPRLYPAELKSMHKVIQEMMQTEDVPDPIPELAINVLTNTRKVNGSICILYPDYMEELAEQHKRSFYIIPSSIHEVLLLEDRGGEDPDELKKMIFEVNENHVAVEEVLSYNLYYYSLNDKSIRIV